MKKLFLFAALAVFGMSSMMAQLSFGAKAGVNFASFSGDDADDLDGLTGFHVGAVANFPLGEMIALQPEVVYSAQGASFSEDGDAKLKFGYINIPVMVDVNLAEGFSLQGGPQFGINISSKLDFDGESEDIEDVNTLDLGVGIGAQYKLPMGVFFQARYVVGFNSVFDDVEGESFDVKNGVASLSVGYMFN